MVILQSEDLFPSHTAYPQVKHTYSNILLLAIIRFMVKKISAAVCKSFFHHPRIPPRAIPWFYFQYAQFAVGAKNSRSRFSRCSCIRLSITKKPKTPHLPFLLCSRISPRYPMRNSDAMNNAPITASPVCETTISLASERNGTLLNS